MRTLLIVLAACGGGTQTSVKPASLASLAPNIRITDAAFAHKYAKHSAHIASGFQLSPHGVSGTGMILAFLEQAQRAGAAYVSDLVIAVQFERNGVAIECVSKVAYGAVAPEPAPVTTADDDHTTVVKPFRPDAIDADVDDRDLSCQQVPEQVIVDEPVVDNRLDASVGRYIEPDHVPTTRTGKVVWSTRCTSALHRRHVHRYEHFIAARFTPPDWDAISRAYADAALVETPPACHQIGKTQPKVPRIEGDLHFTGPLGTALPALWKQ